MATKNSYERRKNSLLNDTTICSENRELWKEFFKFQERKLKRINNLPELDQGNFITLEHYITKFKNMNTWFKNKPWVNLTEKDIRKVYDDLEDGKITKANGKPHKSRDDYYNKVFKSKPFEMAGKSHLAKEVIEYSTKKKEEVRFISEEEFLKMVDILNKPLHKLLFWLSWDIGENINALLQLQRKHFKKQQNPHTKEEEYLVNLPSSILKRSRKARTEITNHEKTNHYIDLVLKNLKEEDYIFPWGYGTAKKLMERVAAKTKIKCTPNGEKVTWKDLRSSMACYLLKQGWTTNEINARLGHTPSSPQIDKYVSFLAIDRHRPKKKLEQANIESLKQEIDEGKKREKLLAQRLENMQKTMEKDIQRRFEKLMRKRK